MNINSNYRSLYLFSIVADEKSLSAAALRLNLSQPTMSQHINKLEEQLGYSLFHRAGGRSLSLTPAGKDLQKDIEGGFTGLDLAWAKAKSKTGSEDSLIIASVHTLFTYYLPDILVGFLNQYPMARPDIRARSSSDVIALSHTRGIDIGLVYDTAHSDPELISYPLFNEEIVIVYKSGPNWAKKILATQCIDAETPIITFQKGYALRSMLDRGMKLNGFSCVAEVDNINLMLSLVVAGIGAAILPRGVADKMSTSLGLTWSSLEYPKLSRNVIAVQRRSEKLRPLAQYFLECCKNHAP
ncbi:LysR family transcriptional regulator [Gammaproteobacteria bacterium AS21]